MNCRSMKSSLFLIAMAVVLALALPRASRADGVERGWDLFETLSASFAGQPFIGVPLGTFDFNNDFNRNIGVQTVFQTDTIVRRNDVVPYPGLGGTGTTALDMVALQLMSAYPFNFAGNGLDSYFVTLQSIRGGPASTGTMDIHFQQPEPGNPVHGTFDSTIDVFFDVRKGGLNGPIVFSQDYLLGSTDTDWSHFPLFTNDLLIPGVNDLLKDFPNGNDISQDFHTSIVSEAAPPPPASPLAIHVVIPTQVPEPCSLALFGIGSLVIGGFCWRRHN